MYTYGDKTMKTNLQKKGEAMPYWIRIIGEETLIIVSASGNQFSDFEAGTTFRGGIATHLPYIRPPLTVGAETSTDEGQNWTSHLWEPSEHIQLESGGGG